MKVSKTPGPNPIDINLTGYEAELVMFGIYGIDSFKRDMSKAVDVEEAKTMLFKLAKKIERDLWK